MASEVLCPIAAVAAQLTVANATTQPMKPVPASATKGERRPSLILLYRATTKQGLVVTYCLWILDSIKEDYVCLLLVSVMCGKTDPQDDVEDNSERTENESVW